MWEIIGVWFGAVGTIGTGVALAFFAYKQNKINKQAQQKELGLRYQAHCLKLIMALRHTIIYFNKTFKDLTFITWELKNTVTSTTIRDKYNQINIINDFWDEFLCLQGEAKLILADDVILMNQDIFEKIKAQYQLISGISLQIEYFFNSNGNCDKNMINNDLDRLKSEFINNNKYFDSDLITPITQIYQPYTKVLLT